MIRSFVNGKREATRIASKGTHYTNIRHLSSEANLYFLLRLLCGYHVLSSFLFNYYMKLLRWGHVIDLDYFGLSTAEMCMQSSDASRNHTDSDLYFNTMRYQDHGLFLLRLLNFLSLHHTMKPKLRK